MPGTVSGSFAAPKLPGITYPKPKAAPGLPGAGIDNPGGPGGYALPSTQQAVAAQQQTDNQTAGGAANYLTDPGYQASLNSQTQGNADIQAELNQALSQALIGYGSPALAAQLSKFGYTLNPEDQAAADANYKAGTATLAQLDQTHSLAKQGVINTLTGHGIADSGDLGYQTGITDQNYANNVYGATNSVLSQIQQLEQNALTQKQGLQGNVNTALQNAWNNVIQNPGAYTTNADVPNPTSQNPIAAPKKISVPTHVSGTIAAPKIKAPVSGYSSLSNSGLH